MCVYDGASPGLLSQLSGMVWMLAKLLKVNNPNQNLGGCPPRRRTALRGFEHIIYKRQDNESDLKSNGPSSDLGLEGGREEDNHKEWRIKAGGRYSRGDAANLHGVVWGTIWKKTGRDDAVLAHTRWL